jgi:phosphatidylinositol 4-kinase
MNFQVARENFIKSQAAYSVISYILQIKDRHNGNILISEKGNLIHIDFGFIFDISPAKNLKFESANFKLTREMVQIMGGSPDSEAYKYYVDLTIRAFLAVRHYYQHMFNIVRLMLNSGLKCFKKDSLKNFTERFQVH